MTSRLKPIRKRTSSGERFQFSVENAYARQVLHAQLHGALDGVEQGGLARACDPSVRGSPRSLAQRPLPSMTIATCRGQRLGRQRRRAGPGRVRRRRTVLRDAGLTDAVLSLRLPISRPTATSVARAPGAIADAPRPGHWPRRGPPARWRPPSPSRPPARAIISVQRWPAPGGPRRAVGSPGRHNPPPVRRTPGAAPAVAADGTVTQRRRPARRAPSPAAGTRRAPAGRRAPRPPAPAARRA